MRGRPSRGPPRRGTASYVSKISDAVRRRTVDKSSTKADKTLIRYVRNQAGKNTCARCGKTAQRLVAYGLQGDRRLLVDAIERAYNASVCRRGSPTLGRQAQREAAVGGG